MSQKMEKSLKTGTKQKLGAPTIPDNFLVGLRNAWVSLLEEAWPEIVWPLQSIRRKRTAGIEAVRIAVKPLARTNSATLVSPLLRAEFQESKPSAVRHKRKRLAEFNKKILEREMELDALAWRGRDVALSLARGDKDGEELLESETIRRYTQIAHDAKALWALSADRDAFEMQLTKEEAFVFQHELLSFLKSKDRYAIEPRQLADSLAGLPTMVWRQSYVRCSQMPYESEPHLHYQVLQVIREVWSMRPKPILEPPAQFFTTKLAGLPKRRGYVRDFLLKHCRDLRLAIEECSKLNHPGESWPVEVTRVFLRLVSQEKTPKDRVLGEREEIKKDGASKIRFD
jgi:hypothetical protein